MMIAAASIRTPMVVDLVTDATKYSIQKTGQTEYAFTDDIDPYLECRCCYAELYMSELPTVAQFKSARRNNERDTKRDKKTA